MVLTEKEGDHEARRVRWRQIQNPRESKPRATTGVFEDLKELSKVPSVCLNFAQRTIHKSLSRHYREELQCRVTSAGNHLPKDLHLQWEDKVNDIPPLGDMTSLRIYRSSWFS